MDVKVQKIFRENGCDLAFRYFAGGTAAPCLVFLGGFKSDMSGTKAGFLMDECRKRGQSCLLFDYSGHGLSGGNFQEGSIGRWLSDSLTVIENTGQSDLHLVGSSMGGWLALLVAEKLKDRVKAVTCIAAAPDFTRDMAAELSPQQQQELGKKGFYRKPSQYGEDLIITRGFLDDGERHCLLDQKLSFQGPVTLLQGKLDDVVPWQKVEAIQACYARSGNKNVKIIYIEDGDHRLSRDSDLEILKTLTAA